MIKNFFKNHPIHKRVVKNFDVLFLFRPTMFFAIWLMIAIGMYLSSLQVKNYPQWIYTFDLWTFIFFLGISLIVVSTLIRNQIDDVDIDNYNNKLFILSKYIDIKLAKKYHFYTALIGIFLLLLVSIYNFIIGVVIFIFWDKLYNDEIYCWKKDPLLGPLCNLIVGVLLMMSGWIFVSSYGEYFYFSYSILSYSFFIKIIPYIFSYLAVILLADIPDIKGDMKYEKTTFAIKYTVKNTMLISLFLVVVALFISLKLRDPLASIAITCSIPFFIYAVFRNQDKDVLRAIRYPIFILNFFTMTIYPYLFLACGLVYYLSKYYYWHRFNLHYPTFLVEHD